MKKKPSTLLRSKAEARLSDLKKKGQAQPANESDIRLLNHELEVHQIELEMQNEELMQAQVRTEALLSQYTDLYDFAPVGYFILARDSAVQQVNLAGVDLLGIERGKLVNRRLGVFVMSESLAVFNTFLENVFENSQKGTCEVALQKKGSALSWVHIEGVAVEGGENIPVCHATLIDITERKQAENEVHAAKKFLDNIINTIADPIFVKDNKRNFLLVNDALCTIVGRSREDLLGKDGDDMFPKDQVDVFRKVDFDVLDTGKDNLNKEDLSNLTTGEIRTIVTHKSRYVDPAGKHFLVGVIRDITDLKLAEEELKKNEIMLRTAVENLPLIFYMFDSNGVFRLSIGAGLKGLGLKPNQVVGQSVLDVYKDFPEITNSVKRSLAGEAVNFESQVNKSSHINFLVPYSTKQGVFAGVVGVALDITERKHVEVTMIKERALLRTLIDNLPNGIFVKDKEYRKIIVNPVHVKEITGHLKHLGESAEKDILGKTDFEIFPRKLAKIFFTDDQKVVRDGSIVLNNEGIGYSDDGKASWMLVSKIPFKDENGEITGMIGITTDITERKLAEEQIQKNLREKEILLKELYHRTKNNMQVICGMLRLKARTLQDDQIKTIFKELETRIYSMALVHQKLMKSKDLSHLNLNDYFESLIVHLRLSYKEVMRNVTVHAEMEDIEVLIDTAVPLGLVFNELISNIIKHAFPVKKSGEINVMLYRGPQQEIVMEVRDNGVGFPKNFNMDKNANLGLETVVDLVEQQLAGNIEFKSQNGLQCIITLTKELYQPRV